MKWQPSPVFLPGKSQGQSLVGYSSWSCKESDMTKQQSTHTHACTTSPGDCFKGVKENEKSCISTPHFSQKILILLQNLDQAEEIIFTCVLNTIG